jgi:hypothetical protein
MERPALPRPRLPRGRRSIALLAALAVVAVVATIAVLVRRGDDDTIIDYWPADPPATARDPHIVASILTAGGMAEAPPGSALVFELQDDGSVFKGGGAGAAGVDRYRLTPEGIERARDLLATIDLGDEDYGEPGITDMPTTTVYVNLGALDGEPADLDVYALSDLDELGELGLSADQQAVRTELLDVIDELTGLVNDDTLVAEPPVTYVPERMDLTFVPWVADEDVTGEPAPEPRPWPLATPLTDRTLGWDGLQLCTTVEGDEVGELTEAMDIEHPDAQEIPWSTGAAAGSGRPTTVAVRAWGLRPGQPACADRAASDPRAGADPLQVDAGPLSSVELADPDGPGGWDGELAADRFRRAEPLELYAVVPAMAAAVATDPATTLSSTDLSWYDYRAVVAVVDDTTYVDIEAHRTVGSTPDPGQPTSWRARTDLATGEVVTIQGG